MKEERVAGSMSQRPWRGLSRGERGSNPSVLSADARCSMIADGVLTIISLP